MTDHDPAPPTPDEAAAPPDGPTARSAVEALAVCHAALADALYGPHALTDATRDDLATIVGTLSSLTRALGNLGSVATTDLAALMESNTEQVGRWNLTRSRVMRTEWDPQWRTAVRDQAVEMLAKNPETGETIGPIKRAVTEAARLVFSTFTPSTAPSVPALRALDIDAGDYRATTPAAWKVTATEAVDE